MSYYKNIEEIERDIAILKLKSEIQEEKIKLRFEHLKEELSPSSLIQGLIGGNSAKSLGILGLVLGLLRKRRRG